MSPVSDTTRLLVVVPDGKTMGPVGQLLLSAEGMLSVARADPSQREQLEALVRRINSKPALFLRAPPAEDAEPLELFFSETRRGTPEFPSAVAEYVRTYSEFELVDLDVNLDASADPGESDLERLLREEETNEVPQPPKNLFLEIPGE